MRKKFSIHDIARELGVSATTISLVLNGKPGQNKISESVRKRILAYVAEIGYKPNPIAQSLRTGRSGIIGMLVEDISDPFFSAIARIVEKRAANLGYKILFSSTENSTEQTKRLLKLMRGLKVDGYIMALPPDIETVLQELIEENIPIVLFDRYFPGIDTHIVEVNNFGGAYRATRHFLDNSYTHIAFITLESSQTQMVGRFRGYLAALEESRFLPVVLKLQYGLDEEAIEEKIKGFLLADPAIDAILFGTNYFTKAGIKVIRAGCLSIPQDIAVISFDDNVHFPMYTPGVTAIAQPLQEISEQSISLLMNLMCGKEKNKKSHIVLDVKLVPRDSSRSKSTLSFPGMGQLKQ